MFESLVVKMEDQPFEDIRKASKLSGKEIGV